MFRLSNGNLIYFFGFRCLNACNFRLFFCALGLEEYGFFRYAWYNASK
jgi:hypothetical protein